MSEWLIHTTVTSAIGFALEIRPLSESPSVTTDKWTPVQKIELNEIQQTSWSEVAPLEKLAEPAKVVVATRPYSPVVRDDAPSSGMVIATLIGVAAFSLLLCLMTLPHHWFHGNTTRWR